MKLFLTLALLCMSELLTAQIHYPSTRMEEVQDNYFGTKVKDPYRWLEDDHSKETEAWVKVQNAITEKYLEQIPFRERVRNRLETLWNYPRYGLPIKEGDYYYFEKNDGLQNQPIWYRQKGLNGAPEVFLDPNQLSEDGTSAISTPTFSLHQRYAAYTISQAGSDWHFARIIDMHTGKQLAEEVRYIKFSGLSWKGDEGFYYSRYPAFDGEGKLKAQNRFHSVYFHKVGTPQTEDVLIYEDKAHPLRLHFVRVTEDQRYLLLTASEGTSGAELWAKDLNPEAVNKDFTLIIKGFASEASFIESNGKKLLVRTNIDAPNYKVVLIDPKHPEKENWQTIIPETASLLQSVDASGGKLILTYLTDASSRVYCTDMDGEKRKEIALPGIGTASGFGGKMDAEDVFYNFSSFVTPGQIYKYNLATGKSSLYRGSEVDFNSDAYTTRQLFFTSKDGTRVPMFVSYKKGLRKDGKNPVLLYGYGGFNIAITPGFSVSNAFFMEQGGIYAVVNLRGGSEYGEKWHEAGMLLNKQNVFDDMIAAAEYLIAEKYTRPSKIAVRGGSNGGLLVGAVMTQRPELFRVAIPQVGVMDMLRYHKFTIGWAWATEYGRSDDEKYFDYLYSYSPLHQLKEGVDYPATLITTADHDDRVVPAHSFKFAATLQRCTSGKYPALIRIETKAGHGAGKSTGKQIDEATDIWSFVMWELGMQYP